jgi:threonine/homoserine/homoserine lactone efflux protein
MSSLWSTLVPLAVGSALVPIQVVITIVLLRSPAGRRAAVAFAAGMTTVRLVQGLVFGLILSSSESEQTSDGSSTILSALLLVVAVLFLVTALRQLLDADDPDGEPPTWLKMTASIGPKKAFLLGAGLLAVSAKFWVFTLGAISAVGEADLGRPGSIVAFLVYVVVAQSVVLAVVLATVLWPSRSDAWLEAASSWLTHHNRIIMIVLGLVFGTWFMVKALDGLGIV